MSERVHFTRILVFIPSIAELLHKAKNVSFHSVSHFPWPTLIHSKCVCYQVLTNLKAAIFFDILLHIQKETIIHL